jgi:hypothetical protein
VRDTTRAVEALAGRTPQERLDVLETRRAEADQLITGARAAQQAPGVAADAQLATVQQALEDVGYMRPRIDDALAGIRYLHGQLGSEEAYTLLRGYRELRNRIYAFEAEMANRRDHLAG